MATSNNCIDNNMQSIQNSQNFIKPVEPVFVKKNDKDNNNTEVSLEQPIKKQSTKPIKKTNKTNENNQPNLKTKKEEVKETIINKEEKEPKIITNDKPSVSENIQEIINQIPMTDDNQEIQKDNDETNTQQVPIASIDDYKEMQLNPNDLLITGLDIKNKPQEDSDALVFSPEIKKVEDISFNHENEDFLKEKLNQLNLPTQIVKIATKEINKSLQQIKQEIINDTLRIANPSNPKNVSMLLPSLQLEDKPTYHSETLKQLSNLKKNEVKYQQELFTLTQNQRLLESESFLNINNSVIEDTKRLCHIKEINQRKKHILDKLEGIHFQVEKVIDTEKKIDRNSLIKRFVDNYEQGIEIYERKAMEYESQSQARREKMQHDLNITLEKRRRECEENEKKTIEKKEKYLAELKRRERELITQRKMSIENIMDKTKHHINLKIQKKENDYLFHKMQDAYEKEQEQLVNKIKKAKKKEIVNPEEINELQRARDDQKIKLAEECIEKTTLMKEMWKNRSLIIPKYKNPIDKIIIEEENKKKEIEDINKFKPSLIAKGRKLFGENKVQQPLANENLKRERERRIIRIDKKTKRRKEKKESLIKVPVPKAKKTLLKAHSTITINPSQYIDDTILVHKTKKYVRSPRPLVKPPPKPHNYLEELRQNNKLKPIHQTNWDKIASDPKGNPIQNIQMIRAQAEIIETKLKQKKNYIKNNGGYENNQELSDKLTDLLVDSIKAKLTIINSLNMKPDGQINKQE